MKSPTGLRTRDQLVEIVQTLKAARLDRQMTQRDVAAALGLKSHGIICRLERGKDRKHGMYASFLLAWAEAVGCEVVVTKMPQALRRSGEAAADVCTR